MHGASKQQAAKGHCQPHIAQNPAAAPPPASLSSPPPRPPTTTHPTPAPTPHAHPQLLNALAKRAAKSVAKHGTELQLAVQVVARLCVQPANEAPQARRPGRHAALHVLGELAPDVQQQHLQLGHVVQRERHHGLVLRKVLVCRAGHEQLADGNAVRAHSPAHIALVELHAAALGGLTGAGELCIARCRLPLVCSKAGAACPVRGIALEHGCGGARLGITCTLGRPSCPPAQHCPCLPAPALLPSPNPSRPGRSRLLPSHLAHRCRLARFAAFQPSAA